jgi:hypothetical protein
MNTIAAIEIIAVIQAFFLYGARGFGGFAAFMIAHLCLQARVHPWTTMSALPNLRFVPTHLQAPI